MSRVGTKISTLISFDVLFGSATFKAVLTFLHLLVKSFFERVATAAATARKEFIESMEVKKFRRKSALKQSQFLKSENLSLRELETEALVNNSSSRLPAAATRSRKLVALLSALLAYLLATDTSPNCSSICFSAFVVAARYFCISSTRLCTRLMT